MAEFLSVHTTSQDALPAPCPECCWWQQAGCSADRQARLEWMTALEQSWGPPGLILRDAGETLAAIQFAPVGHLPRTTTLPPGRPPQNAVLIFCLRARLGRPVHEPVRLLQRTMFEMRRRNVRHLYAYARPLGNDSVCGVRNLFGYEFLTRHGFTVAASDGEFYLMRADLSGLLPALNELKALFRRLRSIPATPSPATWSRPR